MLTEQLLEIAQSSMETIYMVMLSGGIALIIGAPLGTLLFIMQNPRLSPSPILYQLFSFIINTLRAIPFIILMLLCMPLTKAIVGTTIGTTATIIPLSLAAIPFMARLVEQTLSHIPDELLEAGVAMGATVYQMTRYILLPEALASLIQGIGMMLINLIAYSAMAGAIGGGGLGDFAIRYGYHRFDTVMLLIATSLLVGLAQLMQLLTEYLSQRFKHGL
jgi:D-methionine transport system permease protein